MVKVNTCRILNDSNAHCDISYLLFVVLKPTCDCDCWLCAHRSGCCNTFNSCDLSVDTEAMRSPPPTRIMGGCQLFKCTILKSCLKAIMTRVTKIKWSSFFAVLRSVDVMGLYLIVVFNLKEHNTKGVCTCIHMYQQQLLYSHEQHTDMQVLTSCFDFSFRNEILFFK